ncbi:MAG: hypothetical protein ACHQ50_10365 [Fimbriimonadales bacterium]
MAKKPPPVAADGNILIGVKSLSLRIVAVWRANEDSDFEGSFQSEVKMRLLPKNEDATLLSDTFSFLRERYKHRITVIIGGLEVKESGQLVVESRIKRSDECQWLTQSYIIDVLVNASDQPAHAPLEAGDTS